MKIQGSFTVKHWEEQTHLESPNKMSTAKVQYALSEGIEGSADIVYAMGYLSDTQAVFQGVQKITGKIDGKQGSFMMLEQGKFDAPTTRGQWQIIEGSGTGDFTHIAGEGSYTAEHGGAMNYELTLSNLSF